MTVAAGVKGHPATPRRNAYFSGVLPPNPSALRC